MTRFSLRANRRRGVYTTPRARGLLMILGVLLVTVTAARAQVDVTVDPAMTKGTRGAPVTIVEFSDYQ